MNPALLRGACPGLADPMATGDGLLARLVPTGETIPLASFAALCAAATSHGNGVIEITARGSIQVRGLSPASAPRFAAAVTPLGIVGSDSVLPAKAVSGALRHPRESGDPMGRFRSQQRPNWTPAFAGVTDWAPKSVSVGLRRGDGERVLADPLTGLDPGEAIEAGAMAVALRRELRDRAFALSLAPKVSILIDGGGALHLDAIAADLRLCAEAGPGASRLHAALGGDAASATPLGFVAPQHAVELAMRLLRAIAMRGSQARARGVIETEGIAVFHATAGDLVTKAPPPPPRSPAEPIGTHRLRLGRVAVGIGLAFGHADASDLIRLVEAAEGAGAKGVRTAPGRALLVIGLGPERVDWFTYIADRLGFLVRPGDPRRHIAACPGAPACRSGEIPARALAPALASNAAALLDGSLRIHLSGCAKGCAHPGRAALTLVGRRGDCGLVVEGSAQDAPLGSVATEALPAALARLARAVELELKPGEKAANVLARLGAARVSELLMGVTGHG